MAPVLWALLGVAAGAFVTVQAPVNAALGRGLGLPVAAGAISFLAGAVLLSVVTLVLSSAQGISLAWKTPPAWMFLAGGALGAGFVTAMLLLAPRIGALATVGFVIAGQLAAGIVLDRIGFLGLPVHEISAGRLAGAALLIAGAVLVRVS
jgi:transporter family-2 protein